MRFRKGLGISFKLALLIGILVLGIGGPLAAASQEDEAEADAQIKTRLGEIFTAAENKDFNRLESYHLYGQKFTRFSGASPTRLDAAATRQLERKGLALLEHLQMRAESLKIDVFGDVGIATFILAYSFNAGGEETSKRERATLVFAKQGGAWKIVHEHLSEIRTAGANGAANDDHRTGTNSASPVNDVRD